MKSISIIIPTYNPKKYLPKLFQALDTQTIPFELIIIDSSSTDGSATLLKQKADKFISIDKNNFDHGGTRTQALKEASNDIVIFLTQDALPIDQDTLKNLVLCLEENKKIAAAYSRQLPHERTSFFGKHLRYFNYPKNSYIRSFEDKNIYGLKTAFLSNSAAAYKKEALLEIGGFYEHLIVGEDNYAGAKLLLNGYKIAYCAKSKVYHSHSYTLWQEFQRYFDIGVFHIEEAWLIEIFGKAEGEGMRYIKSEFNYLLEQKEYLYIPQFLIRNGLKFLGYKLGKNYKKLPKKLAYFFSMHKAWWKYK